MAELVDLPREIISLICSLLKQSAKYHCTIVNKGLHDAAIPELWREPLLPSMIEIDKLIKCLKISKQPKGEYIRVIKLGRDVSINDDELLTLMQLMPNLEVLELQKADELTDKSIMRVSQYCSQLKSFALSGALVTYRSAHYLGRCQQLQRLTFESCQQLSPIALLPFAELNIEYLDLSGCKWLNVKDTAYDLSVFQHLTHLNLVCCDVVMEFIRRITTTLEGNVCMANLQDFSITGSAIIDDDTIIPFIKTHPNIRGLFLLECAITDATLETISSHLPLLHNLDMSFCPRLTPSGVRRLIHDCPNLRLLGLKNCGITKNDFPEIPYVFTTGGTNYPHLNTLHYLELASIREHTEEAEIVEDETSESEEAEESVAESYSYIQQYLNAEIV